MELNLKIRRNFERMQDDIREYSQNYSQQCKEWLEYSNSNMANSKDFEYRATIEEDLPTARQQAREFLAGPKTENVPAAMNFEFPLGAREGDRPGPSGTGIPLTPSDDGEDCECTVGAGAPDANYTHVTGPETSAWAATPSSKYRGEGPYVAPDFMNLSAPLMIRAVYGETCPCPDPLPNEGFVADYEVSVWQLRNTVKCHMDILVNPTAQLILCDPWRWFKLRWFRLCQFPIQATTVDQ